MSIDLTLKSVQLTNTLASPPVANSPQNGGAALVKEVFGHIASVTAALSATSIIRFCRVPSNARIGSVKFSSGAQAGGAMDLGIYKTAANGGAVVDADLFASAIAVTSQVKVTEMLEESAEFSIAEMAKPLWEVLGLTADPHTEYDVAATITTDITTGTAPVGVRVQYCQ